MAHGFTGIGKVGDTLPGGYKAMANWAWDKLKKAAKTAGSKKKSTGLVLNKDKSIFPVDIIDVDSTEVKEAAQIAGQTSMLGLSSKKGGDIVPNPLTGTNALNSPKSKNVEARSTIIDLKQDDSGSFSPASMNEYDPDNPGALLQKIVNNTSELVRVVNDHKDAMVTQSISRETHDDKMWSRQRSLLEKQSMQAKKLAASNKNGPQLGDLANLAIDGLAGGKSNAAIKMMGGSALAKHAGGALTKSTLGATGTKGIMKYGASRAGKRALLKVGGKGLAKMGLKKIPGIGAIAGLGFGLQRALKGDILGAFGEVASGLASTIPVAGTALSLGIDGALMAKDMAGAKDGALGFGGDWLGAMSPDLWPYSGMSRFTGSNLGEKGKSLQVHKDEVVMNKSLLGEVGEGWMDTVVDRETDFSKAIGMGLYWNQKKYPVFWGGNGKNQPVEKKENHFQFESQLLRGLVGSSVDDGFWGPEFLRIFNENTEKGKRLQKEDRVTHGSGIVGTVRAMTGSKIGDGYIGPKWLGWKTKNAPIVAPTQALRYLISKGVEESEAVRWVEQINSKSGFAGGKPGGLFGWEGDDFGKMKSAVGDDWKTNWQGQLDFLIKDQIILSKDNEAIIPSDGTNNGPGTAGNTMGSAISQLSSDQALVQSGNAPIVVNNMLPGQDGGAVGTTPSGYTNGMSMADTGLEVFSNLRIRSIR